MYEESFGIIPLREMEGIWHVLLIQHFSGHWAFPKGHLEPNEKPKEGAIRELREETGLQVDEFLSDDPLLEKYGFFFQRRWVNKIVSYYLARVSGTITLQKTEISDYRWLTLEEAEQLASFSETKILCHKANKFLENFS